MNLPSKYHSNNNYNSLRNNKIVYKEYKKRNEELSGFIEKRRPRMR